MKKTALLLLHLSGFLFLYGQQIPTVNDQQHLPTESQEKAISSLIDQYSEARENRDTVLLKTILTTDVDQLVSTGEWRTGINAAVEGMMKSSANSPGTRTLRIEKIQMISASSAIADCRYEIQNANDSSRKMWSSFILVANKKTWKIRAIRNMLPAPGK